MRHNYSTKQINLLTTFILLISINTYSQCTEAVADFGNNFRTASYNISGDVSITLNTDNTVTLDLASNFSTASGPDVRAYLIDSNGMTDAEINAEVHNNSDNGISTFKNIAFGETESSGVQSITIDIPENEDISSFDKILFYCLDFSQFWDIGSFSAFNTNSCAILSTEDNSFSSFDIYPNPATDFINIQNTDVHNTEIRIFDLSGKKVFYQPKGNTENTIDISNLNSGIYVLSITENNKQFSKKLILQ